MHFIIAYRWELYNLCFLSCTHNGPRAKRYYSRNAPDTTRCLPTSTKWVKSLELWIFEPNLTPVLLTKHYKCCVCTLSLFIKRCKVVAIVYPWCRCYLASSEDVYTLVTNPFEITLAYIFLFFFVCTIRWASCRFSWSLVPVPFQVMEEMII